MLVSSDWKSPNFRIRMQLTQQCTVRMVIDKVNQVLSMEDRFTGDGEICVGLTSEWMIQNDPGWVYNPQDMLFQARAALPPPPGPAPPQPAGPPPLHAAPRACRCAARRARSPAGGA